MQRRTDSSIFSNKKKAHRKTVVYKACKGVDKFSVTFIG